MDRYHSATRYQIVKIAQENGKDRPVNGPALPSFEKAKEILLERYKEFGGVYIIVDTKPMKRSGGFIEKERVIFNTLTMGE